VTPGYPNAKFLAETDWLSAHLDDDDVRVIDARFGVRAREDGTFEEVSGRADYLNGHIPGAQFVDLRTDLTDPDDPTSIVGPDRFAALMNRLGIGPRSTVVIYDDRGGVWAARLWWALRYYGHDNARLLNGGLGAWLAAGHELRQDTEIPPQSQFEAVVRANLRVTKEDVLSGIDEAATCIVDALPEPFYLGQASLFPSHRRGHIPGARNLPAEGNLDPQTLRIRTKDALQKLSQDAGIAPDQTVITYCGSGVFASFALFILVLMGHEKVALYDASWMEWGGDDTLPVEMGGPGQHIPKT
jgi:thiosulfate/3-mercaptopyruvate sulfurtransferase